ncbi:hypothetical protein L1987_11243 [Smallanthus sonchifolius]|uniref:Uncharacterized protein n=1 Tax=Smallanthus sonchifolius TaxID=185202 RepID=A0ACB9JDV8_9ASTR|nr:hypothetical protein L1987_11243 [Smallanthus sonchifolius]
MPFIIGNKTFNCCGKIGFVEEELMWEDRFCRGRVEEMDGCDDQEQKHNSNLYTNHMFMNRQKLCEFYFIVMVELIYLLYYCEEKSVDGINGGSVYTLYTNDGQGRQNRKLNEKEVDIRFRLELSDDSKTLKEERRKELFESLKADETIGWDVDVIDPRVLSVKMLQKSKKRIESHCSHWKVLNFMWHCMYDWVKLRSMLSLHLMQEVGFGFRFDAAVFDVYDASSSDLG